jgi:pre-mRNA-splicing factor SPF27
MSALLDACAARAPDATGPLISAVDLSRYEDPSATDAEILAGARRVLVASSTASSLSPREASEAADAAAASSPLHRLCAAHAYLAARRENLDVMQEYGKDAWLQANAHLEAEVKALELEAEAERRAVDELAEARRRAQDVVAGEAASLSDSWRRGVERMVGVQVAVEVARARVREHMRAAVQ